MEKKPPISAPSNRTSCNEGNVVICQLTQQLLATWLLSIWNASVTKELNFLFYLILVNLNSHIMLLAAILLDIAALFFTQPTAGLHVIIHSSVVIFVSIFACTFPQVRCHTRHFTHSGLLALLCITHWAIETRMQIARGGSQGSELILCNSYHLDNRSALGVSLSIVATEQT